MTHAVLSVKTVVVSHRYCDVTRVDIITKHARYKALGGIQRLHGGAQRSVWLIWLPAFLVIRTVLQLAGTVFVARLSKCWRWSSGQLLRDRLAKANIGGEGVRMLTMRYA